MATGEARSGRFWQNEWVRIVVGVLLTIPAGVAVVYLTTQPKTEDADRPSTRTQDDPAAVTPTSSVGSGVRTPTPTPTPTTAPSEDPVSEAPVPEPTPTAAPIATPAVIASPLPQPAPDQRGCPARQAALNFKFGTRTKAFVSLSGSDMVKLFDCDPASGDFSTSLAREVGTLGGTGGRWSKDNVRFDFGYRSDNGWGDIQCSVNADATASRTYAGTISCAASGRRGSWQEQSEVIVSL